MIDWDKVKEGTKVDLPEGKEGIFIEVAGGEDKGKLRVKVKGDRKKFREVPMELVGLKKAKKPAKAKAKPEPVNPPVVDFKAAEKAMAGGKYVKFKGMRLKDIGTAIVAEVGVDRYVPVTFTGTELKTKCFMIEG